MEFILGEIKKLRNEIEYKLPKKSQLALIINGDMNSEPNQPTIKQIFDY
jgi:endonuclease/exonuclease/phosphatase family metal-dependent hydrolase